MQRHPQGMLLALMRLLLVLVIALGSSMAIAACGGGDDKDDESADTDSDTDGGDDTDSADTDGGGSTPPPTTATPPPEEEPEEPEEDSGSGGGSSKDEADIRTTLAAVQSRLKRDDPSVCFFITPELAGRITGSRGGVENNNECVRQLRANVEAKKALSELVAPGERITTIVVRGSQASARTSANDRVTLKRDERSDTGWLVSTSTSLERLL